MIEKEELYLNHLVIAFGAFSATFAYIPQPNQSIACTMYNIKDPLFILGLSMSVNESYP